MLQNIKQKIEKNWSFIILIFIFSIVTSLALNQKFTLMSNDEIWNFSNTYKMKNGFTIYKDLNIIITPLFFYIGTLILNIFSANLLVYKIYNSIIHILMFFTIYKIFQAMNIKK